MTLDQVFPDLQNAPGDAIVSMADDVLDLTGPANEMSMEVLRNTSTRLEEQIKAIDPAWHYDRLGPTTTVEGMTNEVDNLRFQRAAVLARVKGDYGPLQVETLRFVQQRTDDAYDDALALQKAGKLRSRLSDQEAVGNYVDKEVREQLRERYNMLGIDFSAGEVVRVNSREYDRSGNDATYRIPDSRVGDVAYDVTLSRKTSSSGQVRGFFNADFRPNRVIIVRPSQTGKNHTYVIARPEIK